MSFTRALIACGLLAMMISPARAEDSAKSSSVNDSSKQLIKEEKHSKKERQKELEREQKEERKKAEHSEASTEKSEKAAENKAHEAQSREKGLPSHEDHHKLGAHDNVDKGFDFNTSNSK